MNSTEPPISQQLEKVERIYRRHPLNLLSPILISIVMLFPILIILPMIDTLGYLADPLFQLGAWLFSGVYAAFVLNFFIMEWIFWYLDVWVLTSNRLMDVQLISLFNRQVSQLPLVQIQDVRVDTKGYLPSIFRYGDITVQSAGSSGFFILRSIPGAKEVAQTILEFADATRGDDGHASAVRTSRPTQRLGEILLESAKISGDELVAALETQRQTGHRLGQILLSKGLISREDLVGALGSQFHIPSIDLSRYEIDARLVQEVPYELALRYTIVPVARSAEALTLAIAHPSPEVMGELASQFDAPLAFMVADEEYIKEAILGYYVPPTDSGSEPGDDGSATLGDLGL